MYTPEKFRMNDEDEIRNFIFENSFAILVSLNGKRLTATHLPLVLVPGEGKIGTLYGHFARANTQWKDYSGEVLAVFSGAHRYISPSWYETKQAVPTWNYLAVHAYGNMILSPDHDDTVEIIRLITDYYEKSGAFKIEDAGEEYLNSHVKGIVAFRIEITELQGKKKLSQNHSDERQQRVISALKESSDDNSSEIAKQMLLNRRK